MRRYIESFRSYWLRDISFISLLLVLAFTIFAMPVLIDLGHADMVLLNILFLSIFFVGIWSAQGRIELVLSITFFTIHLVLKIIRFGDSEWEFPIMEKVVASLNTLVFIFINFRLIFRDTHINFERIIGAINVYLLMAMLGAFLYELIHLSIGTSLEGNIKLSNKDVDYVNYIYFSLVSLTAVGYGDIFPANQTARMLSVFLSTIGILYPAVIIARLVSAASENKVTSDQEIR